MTSTRKIYKNAKTISKDFETEWIANKPGHHTTQRFERILNSNDTRQLNKLKLMIIPIEIPPTNLSTIYGLKNKKWILLGHKCMDCGKPMKDPKVLAKHSLLCRNEKEINKQQEQEILKLVKKDSKK